MTSQVRRRFQVRRATNPLCVVLLTALLCVCCMSASHADIVLYRVPGVDAVVALQGKTTVNQGATVTYSHPQFGRLYFDLQDARIHKVPTTNALFARKMRQAEGKPDELMKTASWALRNGLVNKFYEPVVKTLAVNPQHADALRIRDLKKQMLKPIGDSSKQEQEMRALVGRPDMKVKLSPHFILLHDTDDKPQGRKRLTRAEQRLELLEMVYESFLLRFFAHGVALDIPKERLKVVLFKEHKDYLVFVSKLSPALKSASGFWDTQNNTAVFFDQGSTEEFQALLTMSSELQKLKKDATKQRARNRPSFQMGGRVLQLKDLARMADTLQLLVSIQRENLDIEVVSHEATHQMAGNTGLLPRHVMVPSWVHEGLATYFETPGDAAWGGIGAVNASRLDLYRQLERDREHSNIDFIVSDQIFDTAANLGGTLHGYGQAWALTHFLMENHFDKFIAYYRRLGEMPPDVVLNPAVLKQLFRETVGEPTTLDGQWRAYMNSLKTDIELILEEENK